MTFILIGNKCDMENDRAVSTAEGEKFARDNDMIFLETSAKTALNVEEAFLRTAEIIYDKIKRGVIDPSNETLGVKFGNDQSQTGKLTAGGKKTEAKGDCACQNLDLSSLLYSSQTQRERERESAREKYKIIDLSKVVFARDIYSL
eukprot:TRINITY_DN1319_c0_g1_i1.p4 TRINITY_DN1319_c0_g1~~TRINITY_DN1319_c0_g1_i1.p4  ORF type:complete len:146 (-),score=39.85 TRINITY_DN1319_c0_g1_i1:148-585(-)